MLTVQWTLGLMLSTIEALIAEEKLIHVETPGSYQQLPLSEFCITPSEDQTLKFDVEVGSDAITQLFTDSGTSGFCYEIVIGGNGNRAAILRRSSTGIIGDKQYIFVENPVQYRRPLGQRVDVGILDVMTVKSALDCARRCHQHINCNQFNFGRISMNCELVGAPKTDSKTNINYDVYSQC